MTSHEALAAQISALDGRLRATECMLIAVAHALPARAASHAAAELARAVEDLNERFAQLLLDANPQAGVFR